MNQTKKNSYWQEYTFIKDTKQWRKLNFTLSQQAFTITDYPLKYLIEIRISKFTIAPEN